MEGNQIQVLVSIHFMDLLIVRVYKQGLSIGFHTKFNTSPRLLGLGFMEIVFCNKSRLSSTRNICVTWLDIIKPQNR